MESVAVIKVSLSFKRAKLVSFCQDQYEPFRKSTTCVLSKAKTCNFTTVIESECRKKNVTKYTEEVIKDMMLAGVGDKDIRKVVLSTENILSRSQFDIIFYIVNKETGRQQQRTFKRYQRYALYYKTKVNKYSSFFSL